MAANLIGTHTKTAAAGDLLPDFQGALAGRAGSLSKCVTDEVVAGVAERKGPIGLGHGEHHIVGRKSVWDHSRVIALAQPNCARCHGSGLRILTARIKEPLEIGRRVFRVPRTREVGTRPCKCVLRAIFRACLNRWMYCAAVGTDRIRISYERTSRAQGKAGLTAGFKAIEYLADFELVARRVLDPLGYQVFRLHFLMGMDWREAVPRINRILALDRPLNQGSFFHEVYRVEEFLGRAYADLQPYALHPVPAYFGGHFSAWKARRFYREQAC